MFLIDEPVEDYARTHTQEEPELLRELAAETHRRMAYPQMLTGRIEGRLLKLLVQVSSARYVVEVGTFTGYSALCMAEGLPAGGRITTCEIDAEAAEMALSYFARSPYGTQIDLRLGAAAATLPQLAYGIDLAFVDADKEGYLTYYELLLEKLKPGGLMLFDNALWSGRVLEPQDPESRAIAELNLRIADDGRVENVLLTVRDGINMVRKK